MTAPCPHRSPMQFSQEVLILPTAGIQRQLSRVSMLLEPGNLCFQTDAFSDGSISPGLHGFNQTTPHMKILFWLPAALGVTFLSAVHFRCNRYAWQRIFADF